MTQVSDRRNDTIYCYCSAGAELYSSTTWFLLCGFGVRSICESKVRQFDYDFYWNSTGFGIASSPESEWTSTLSTSSSPAWKYFRRSWKKTTENSFVSIFINRLIFLEESFSLGNFTNILFYINPNYSFRDSTIDCHLIFCDLTIAWKSHANLHLSCKVNEPIQFTQKLF